MNQIKSRDMPIKCIRFAVPEAISLSGEPDSLCSPRNFKARFIAQPIDFSYRCCENPEENGEDPARTQRLPDNPCNILIICDCEGPARTQRLPDNPCNILIICDCEGPARTQRLPPSRIKNAGIIRT